MKRAFLTFAVLVVAFALQAAGFATLNLGVSSNSSSPFQDQTVLWREWERPDFADIGFVVQTPYMLMAADFPFRTDMWDRLNDSGVATNIPFVTDTLDVNFPGKGFADFTFGESGLCAGVGRRSVKWGYGTYGMAVNDSQPYLDCIDLSYDNGRFSYSFMAVGYPQWMNTGEDYVEKTLAAHRFGLSWDNFHMVISELNLIYGRQPSVFDFSPFALWHDNFQDGCSNVILDIQAELLALGSLRVFGSFTMDDLVIGNEHNGQPTAMGFSLGAEYNITEKERRHEDLFTKSDASFSRPGLNVGAEWYYCSAFMFNRSESVKEGRFTVPMHYLSNVCTEGRFYNRLDGYFQGFPYGPDTMLFRTYASYDDGDMAGLFSVEAILCGSASLNGLAPIYGTSTIPDDMNILSLNGPVTTVIRLQAKAGKRFTEGLEGSASLSWDVGYGFSADVGVRFDF